MATHPTAFASYSWDDDLHKEWVAQLASRLRADGIDVHLDQWHAVPGDQLPHFMEREIRDNDYVIVVCTPHYKKKSDSRSGGVGYEGDVMTAEVFTKKNDRKFIPVLARGPWTDAAPSWLVGKYYVDLSDCEKLDQNYTDLLNTITGNRQQAPQLGKPPIGRYPSSQSQPSQSATSTSDPIRIIGVVVDEVTEPSLDGTRGSALYRVPFKLSRSPSNAWEAFFLNAWQFPPQFTTMHRPSIASVVGDRIVLNGTTIEEVQQYHKNTLKLCVGVANTKEAEWKARRDQAEQLARQKSDAHRRSVNDIASGLSFD
jgi:SEFIR domain.